MTRIINQAQIAKLIHLDKVIPMVEQVYAWKAEEKTTTFPLIFHIFEGKEGDMDIKSGEIEPAGIFGCKIVSFFERNPQQDKAPLQGTINLFSNTTGELLSIMEGTYLTGLRTSAAATIGACHLACKEVENILIIGAGHQCLFQAAAILSKYPDIQHLFIYDPLSFDQATKKASTLKENIKKELGMEIGAHIKIQAVDNLQEAVQKSKIIITITPSRKPLVKASWVTPGTHFSCVGSDMKGKQELDPQILSSARVFTDDMQQCKDVGEIELAYHEGMLDETHLIGELGDVILGKCAGRLSPEDITVFDTTGIAIQDLMAANVVYKEAEANDIGICVNL